MSEKLNPRLRAVYRSIDDCRMQIDEAMEPLSRYEEEVTEGLSDENWRRGGRFDAATRELFRKALQASVTQSNRLAAIYRDIELLPDARRIKLDDDTGAFKIDVAVGEVGLMEELLQLLHEEDQRWQQLFK